MENTVLYWNRFNLSLPEAESIRLNFAPSRLRSEVRSRFEPTFCRYGFHNIILTPPPNVRVARWPRPLCSNVAVKKVGCCEKLVGVSGRKVAVKRSERLKSGRGFGLKWQWRLVGIWQPCPTCPVPARQNLTSPLTCQTGLPSQIERVGSNPLFAQNLTSEVSLAKSYGFGLWSKGSHIIFPVFNGWAWVHSPKTCTDWHWTDTRSTVHILCSP